MHQYIFYIYRYICLIFFACSLWAESDIWSGGCEQSSILASSHSTMSADHGAGAATGMGHHHANPNSNCLKLRSLMDELRSLMRHVDFPKKVNDPVMWIISIYESIYVYVHVGCGYIFKINHLVPTTSSQKEPFSFDLCSLYHVLADARCIS